MNKSLQVELETTKILQKIDTMQMKESKTTLHFNKSMMITKTQDLRNKLRIDMATQ